LTLISLAGLGLFSAGLSLLFKRAESFHFFANSLFRFFSGVYFPVTIFPLGLRYLSQGIPFTHALEALRRAALQGSTLSELRGEVFALAAFTVILLPGGIIFFRWAYHRSLRLGSLFLT
jgi:ABC-2 type transport system permease protein